ncbi:MAG: DUF2905 domain-containing protein [Chloroflexi bacterium]|nr:DUF2905 domain-containing protein [Chloroflexota bacterium]
MPALDSLGRLLLAVGIALAIIGLMLLVASKVNVPLFGRLPGDLLIRKGRFSFYFPIVTMVLVSLVLTVLLNLVFRLFRT